MTNIANKFMEDGSPMGQINLISPLTLAFVGDAVHTLFVREKFLKMGTETPKKLHNLSAARCCASSQAKALDEIEKFFTDEEKEIVRRARNSKNHNAPKNSNIEEYKKATSFEALLGYLFLSNNIDRIKFFFNETWSDIGD